MSKVYTDVFNIQHTDCTVVDTINEFSRIFIIQDKNDSRFTCLKDDAKPAKKGSGHWTSASPEDAPQDYAVPYRSRKRQRKKLS
ncbi:hypothetical protein [Lactiplantibacillus pentosus]|uniref:hypothetical protein n=1 Tax=Lactiplantibacillus pentosus TaxID=1589 RepID=UPI001C1ED40A|nr:hypothetical protein [Lactiplantibacillus pentosus]MBU7463296.1 hypothetical protein [Lactiplantibacillus pentosus]MBU7491092.1 hypothetical protein [Lactiplantibacillus pentosus]MBU7494955.1 hypothetical protein [Lactiplantibacillus pentosus]MBU7520961.1 hypothetical protein [Lactiplantibacillus pentosus]MBU7525353.1 hypothetical protein [Lactiplantibacillus pentosus]